jgi:hypothetical protein
MKHRDIAQTEIKKESRKNIGRGTSGQKEKE